MPIFVVGAGMVAYVALKQFAVHRLSKSNLQIRNEDDDAHQVICSLVLEDDPHTDCIQLTNIDDATLECIAYAMRHNTHVTEIQLIYPNAVTSLGLLCLGQIVQQDPSPLRRIELDALPTQPFIPRFIETIVSRESRLQELCIRNIDLEGYRLNELLKGLTRNTTLRRLDLCGGILDTAGVVALCRALSSHTSLQHLGLCEDQYLSVSACEALGLLLLETQSLKHLDLFGGRLDPLGALYLATALETNATLEFLDLRVTGLKGALATHALARALERSPNWKGFIVYGNSLGRNGCTQMLKALTNRPSGVLQSLQLCWDATLPSNQTDKEGEENDNVEEQRHDHLSVLQTVLECNTTLVRLDLSAFELHATELPTLFRALEGNTALQCLKLTHIQELTSLDDLLAALIPSIPHLQQLKMVTHDLKRVDRVDVLVEFAQVLFESNRSLESFWIPQHVLEDFWIRQIDYALGPLHRSIVGFFERDPTQSTLSLWPYILERVWMTAEDPYDCVFRYLRNDPSLVLGRPGL